jgi:hypothetical protein
VVAPSEGLAVDFFRGFEAGYDGVDAREAGCGFCRDRETCCGCVPDHAVGCCPCSAEGFDGGHDHVAGRGAFHEEGCDCDHGCDCGFGCGFGRGCVGVHDCVSDRCPDIEKS